MRPLLVVTALVATAAALEAQPRLPDVQVGARVRVHAAQGTSEGTVLESAPDSVVIVQAACDRRTYRAADITRLVARARPGIRGDLREIEALAKDRDVLNCFCYTGGFSLAALKGGARSVVSIDSSGEALAVAERNVTLNGFDPARAEWLDADVFKSLRNFRAEGRQFDLIVLDPPKFAASAQQVDRAARAYKEINLVGMQLLRPGGLLFTYSCSGAIDADLFQKIVAGAAADACASARSAHHCAKA